MKFKDSDCYPIKFDLFRLIAISDNLTFPMVWHKKYYLKKVIQIDKRSIFILGRSLESEVTWTPAPEEVNFTLSQEDQDFILTKNKIDKLIGSKVDNNDFSSCKIEIIKIIGTKSEE